MQSPDAEPRPKPEPATGHPSDAHQASFLLALNQAVLDRHIDRIFLSRVGIRFLVKHYVASREPVGPANPHPHPDPDPNPNPSLA